MFLEPGADPEALEHAGPIEFLPGPEPFAAAVADGSDRVVLCSARHLRAHLAALISMSHPIPVATIEATPPEWMDGLARSDRVGLAIVAWPAAALDLALAGPCPIFPLSPAVQARIRAVGWLDDRGRVAREARAVAALDLGRPPPAALADALRQEGLAVEAENGPCSAPALVLCHPESPSLGASRARGIPVLLVTPGEGFGSEPYAEADRAAQALFLAGEAEVLPADLPAEAMARAIRLALRQRSEAARGGAELAVRLVERMAAARDQRTLPELRP